MDSFVVWMQSLDAVKVSAAESFIGERHRQLLFEHEVRRIQYQGLFSVAGSQQSATEFWANVDAVQADTPVKTRKRASLSTRRSTIESRAEPVFTSTQLAIATKALEKQRG